MAQERRRNIVLCAEDTPAAQRAAEWAVSDVYREGDKFNLVYVVKSLKPPMEVFHGMPGTAYAFAQPGPHRELEVIADARERLTRRYLPCLQPRMVPYELHLFAEREDAPASRVGELILKAADQCATPLVVLAAHNKACGAVEKPGSVAAYIIKECKRPLAIIHPD